MCTHKYINTDTHTRTHIYACICVTSTNFDSHYVFRLRPPFLRLCFVSPFLFCGFIFQLAALFDRVKRNGPKRKWREMEFELFHTIETVLFVSLYSSHLLFFVHLLYFTRSTYHTFCFCVLSRFTLLYHGYLVEHLHGVQFACIVSSQFTNEKHASVCCSICKRKLINSLFILIPLCSMLTSRAKHAYDFKIVETHALIAIQFD